MLAGDSLATAFAMELNGQTADVIGTPAEVDFFKLTLNESGRLTVRAQLGAAGHPGHSHELIGSGGPTADPERR